jgi:hypothetical protein
MEPRAFSENPSKISKVYSKTEVDSTFDNRGWIRTEISVHEQEIPDFPRVCEERQKNDSESAERPEILEITTLSP